MLRRLHARYPAIELVIVTGNSREVAAAVAANQLDLAIVTLPVSARALVVEPLRVDPLVAIAPAGRPWRRRAPFTPAELSRHPLILYERGGTIRQVIDEWFRKAGVTPHVAMELGNAEAIKKLVGAGLGLSLASTMAVAAEVKAQWERLKKEERAMKGQGQESPFDGLPATLPALLKASRMSSRAADLGFDGYELQDSI
jgi:DNA-binding transcriptional LysR family regulator